MAAEKESKGNNDGKGWRGTCIQENYAKKAYFEENFEEDMSNLILEEEEQWYNWTEFYPGVTEELLMCLFPKAKNFS